MKTTIGCALAGLLAVSPGAAAFGLKTHLWIGQQIVDDVQEDCVVTIGGTPQRLQDDVCTSIRKHPREFRAGTLGPDIYPDLVTGQLNMHPGLGDDRREFPKTLEDCGPATGWNTSDWLRHVYHDAAPGPDLAFAAGYLVHAASDVFAHTLVNAYAGNTFDLQDGETDAEYRHAIIERYVDSQVRLDSSSTALVVPSRFVSQKLLLGSCAGREASRKWQTGHIRAMSRRYMQVRKLMDDFDAAKQQGDEVGRGATDAGATLIEALDRAPIDLAVKRLAANALRIEISMSDADRQEILASYTEKAANRRAIAADSPLARDIEEDLERSEEHRARQFALNDLVEDAARIEATIPRLRTRLGEKQRMAREAEQASRKAAKAREKTREWLNAMEASGEAYLAIAHDTATEIATGDAVEEDEKSYLQWMECHALAFAEVRRLAKLKCKLGEWEQDIAETLEDVPGWSILSNAKQAFDDLVLDSAKALVLKQLRNQDHSLPRLAALLADPRPVERHELQAIYKTYDANGVVTFQNVADLVDDDLAIGPEPWDPARAPVVRHAVSLSKISLLDRGALRQLASDLGGDASRVRLIDGSGRYSVLYQTVRSIDGNHQWQRHGLPYWRSDGSLIPLEPDRRRYGYDATDAENMGFPFFVDPTLREVVFPRIFDAPVYGSLAEHMGGFTLAPGAGTRSYPFPVANGFDFDPGFEGECDLPGRPTTRNGRWQFPIGSSTCTCICSTHGTCR